jgi:hypothetical protein
MNSDQLDRRCRSAYDGAANRPGAWDALSESDREKFAAFAHELLHAPLRDNEAMLHLAEQAYHQCKNAAAWLEPMAKLAKYERGASANPVHVAVEEIAALIAAGVSVPVSFSDHDDTHCHAGPNPRSPGPK